MRIDILEGNSLEKIGLIGEDSVIPRTMLRNQYLYLYSLLWGQDRTNFYEAKTLKFLDFDSVGNIPFTFAKRPSNLAKSLLSYGLDLLVRETYCKSLQLLEDFDNNHQPNHYRLKYQKACVFSGHPEPGKCAIFLSNAC